MTRSIRFSLMLLLAAAACGAKFDREPGESSTEKPEPKVRRFLFHYRAALNDLEAGADVRVWLPVPPSNDDQRVEIVEKDLPAEATLGQEEEFGNSMLYFQAKAGDEGTLECNVSYQVERREVRAIDGQRPADDLSEEERERFLEPDALVPIEGKPLSLIAMLSLADDPLALGRQLYERVGEHMSYSKEGIGWGQGDVLWACDSQYGNCTDFHSLFISLARSQGLPARFEMGFPLPPERGEGQVAGYHCWAYFHTDHKGWVPVDISEADKHPEMLDYYFGNLTEDRVTFTVGRDLTLAPEQDGPPLNYFIYPYAEVEGKPLPKSKFTLDFSYRDQE